MLAQMENRLDPLPDTRGSGLSIEDRLRRRYASPEARLAFDRAVEARLATAELVAALEEVREALGVSKASLASRTGRSASVVSRVLSSRASNPTVLTVFELLEAMGLRVRLTIEEPHGKGHATDRPVIIETALGHLNNRILRRGAPATRRAGRRSAAGSA